MKMLKKLSLVQQLQQRDKIESNYIMKSNIYKLKPIIVIGTCLIFYNNNDKFDFAYYRYFQILKVTFTISTN